MSAVALLSGCQATNSSEGSPELAADAAAAPALPARPWEPLAFDEASGQTTPLDQMQFLALLTKAEEPHRKDEFKTTEQHRARTRDLAQVIAPIRPDADYLFAPRYNDLEYGADKHQYVGRYRTDCYEFAFDDGQVACEFGE
jgi:hypothetical protein